MTTVVISQPMLFPWPGFFEQLSLADVFIHLDDAQFSKGSFTNRIQVKFADGRRWMTVPLDGKGSFRKIGELEAAGDNWKKVHRDLLCRSLRDAPYLADALAILDEVHREERLCDLLIASIDVPAAYLGIAPNRTNARSGELGIEGTSWQRVLDLVHRFQGDRYLTGHGAAQYLDHEAFEAAGVDVEYMAYSLTPWPQAHGEFMPYVTILDLIAHTGPQAADYLKPNTVPWRLFTNHTKVTT